jgi:hypothetical protein
MSALLAKEQGLEIDLLLKLLAEGVNGSELLVYGTTIAEVNITDFWGKNQTHSIPFVVTDLKRY